LPVTQAVIANLLGVRREGIIEAAGALRQLVKRETDRLLPDRPTICDATHPGA